MIGEKTGGRVFNVGFQSPVSIVNPVIMMVSVVGHLGVRCSKGSYGCVCACPVLESDARGSKVLLDEFTHGFPEHSNLVVTRARLQGHVLFRVKPPGFVAIEHVLLDVFTVCVC